MGNRKRCHDPGIEQNSVGKNVIRQQVPCPICHCKPLKFVDCDNIYVNDNMLWRRAKRRKGMEWLSTNYIHAIYTRHAGWLTLIIFRLELHNENVYHQEYIWCHFLLLTYIKLKFGTQLHPLFVWDVIAHPSTNINSCIFQTGVDVKAWISNYIPHKNQEYDYLSML